MRVRPFGGDRQSHPPDRRADVVFVWLAGRLALDLCNTRLGDRELLARADDLVRWMLTAGLQRPGVVGPDDLRATQRLRDGLRTALLSGDAVCVAELAEEWLRETPGCLCVEATTLMPRFTPGGRTAACAMVPVVLDALELAREEPGRVRECAAAACPVVFHDTSRNRSRRWCSMEVCGARAKAVAYYRRHRGGP